MTPYTYSLAILMIIYNIAACMAAFRLSYHTHKRPCNVRNLSSLFSSLNNHLAETLKHCKFIKGSSTNDQMRIFSTNDQVRTHCSWFLETRTTKDLAMIILNVRSDENKASETMKRCEFIQGSFQNWSNENPFHK